MPGEPRGRCWRVISILQHGVLGCPPDMAAGPLLPREKEVHRPGRRSCSIFNDLALEVTSSWLHRQPGTGLEASLQGCEQQEMKIIASYVGGWFTTRRKPFLSHETTAWGGVDLSLPEGTQQMGRVGTTIQAELGQSGHAPVKAGRYTLP